MKLVRETNLKIDNLALNKFKTMELTKVITPEWQLTQGSV